MSLLTLNFSAWFVQAALVAGAGALLPLLFGLRHARARLIYWQTVLLLCLALPLVQPWRPFGGKGAGVVAGVAFRETLPMKTPAGVPYEKILLFVLAAGAAVRFARLGAGLLRLRAWRAGCRPFSHPLPGRLGIAAELAISDDVSGPVTFGRRHPLVLAPPGFLELPEAQQESALCHELIHIRRGDWAVTVAEEIVGAALWFHPAIWWLLGQIQLAREQAVDREVVRLTGSREAYLETLLATASAQAELDLAPAPLFLRKRHLARRVGALLKESTMSKSRLFLSLAASLFAVLAAGVVSMTFFPLRSMAQSQFNVTIYRNQPGYPAAAASAGVQGQVIVDRTIGPDGGATGARVVSGPAQLHEAALSVARQSRLDSGATAPRSALLAINFVLADEPSAPPKRIRVGGEVQAKKVIHKVNPPYPPVAKEAHIEGKVELQIVISREGSVKEVKVLSGEAVLAEAAEEAVKQWLFTTTLLNGEPIEVVAQVDFNFTLKD